MPRIYVDFAGLKQIKHTCKSVSSGVSDIRSDFQRTVRQLDWDVKFQSNINSTAAQLARKLESYTTALKSYQSFIDDAYDDYRELDRLGFDNDTLDIASIAHDISDTSNSEDDADKQFFSVIKAVLKWLDKTDSDKDAGITNDGLSYFESLYKFFTGDMTGLTGAEDWFDLCDNSIGLWTGFYDYLKDFYNKAGDTFSVGNQTKVAGLGIIGNLIGFVSDIFGAADTISNTEDLGVAGILGEIIGTGDNVVDIWSSVEKLLHISDTSTNITTTSGVYSPLTFYATIAKSYLSAISQGFSSFEKYSADGAWDLGDTAATGIEASVEGLYSMVSALTFGLVSDGTTGVSASDISNALENWSEDIGTQAGNYIASDPTLYQMYQDSNAVGKALLTFYTALWS